MAINLLNVSIILLFILNSTYFAISQSQPKRIRDLPLPPTLAPVYHTHGHPDPGSNPEHSLNSSQPGMDTSYPHYTSRANLPIPPNSEQSPYITPFTSAAYDGEVYGTSRDTPGNPILGISSNADFQLSAFFGQIFWSAVTLVATIASVVYFVKFFTGYDVIGGIINKFRGTVANGKSLDLEHLTKMVYEAFERYGKYTEGLNEDHKKNTGEKKQVK